MRPKTGSNGWVRGDTPPYKAYKYLIESLGAVGDGWEHREVGRHGVASPARAAPEAPEAGPGLQLAEETILGQQVSAQVLADLLGILAQHEQDLVDFVERVPPEMQVEDAWDGLDVFGFGGGLELA